MPIGLLTIICIVLFVFMLIFLHDEWMLHPWRFPISLLAFLMVFAWGAIGAILSIHSGYDVISSETYKIQEIENNGQKTQIIVLPDGSVINLNNELGCSLQAGKNVIRDEIKSRNTAGISWTVTKFKYRIEGVEK